MNLHLLINFVLSFAFSRGLEVNITSLNRLNNDGMSMSRTHQTGRAADISVKNWTKKDIVDLIILAEKKMNHIGAISMSDKKVRPIVYHDSGHGWHLHLQVKR